jgi:hypothetical protein
LEWETARLGEGAAGAVLPFMIEDRTERNLRVRSSVAVQDFHGVGAVVIGVRELASACALFKRAFGLRGAANEEHPEFGARVACFVGTPVMLAEGLHGDSWIAQRVAQFGERPAGFLLKGVATGGARWFGRSVQWFDETKLGARVGVVG